MTLYAVPCAHYWLAIEYRKTCIIAICKFYGCRKRGQFTLDEWQEMKVAGTALDKPMRV